MNRVGVIDIGSNAIRFMLTEVEESGYFRIIDELSTTVRLGYDLINDDVISKEKIEKTLSVLTTFKSLASNSKVSEIITVATETLSSAKNKDEFVSIIKENLDIDVIVLSSEEELYFSYLGVIKSIYFNNSLLVDVAGVSTYIAWIVDGEIKESVILPIGCINLTYEYNLQDRILIADLEAAISKIYNELIDIEWLGNNKFDSIIGVGGTVRAIAKMNKIKNRYPFDITHNYIMTDYDVHDIFNLLKCKDIKLRNKVEGLSKERADIIVGGASILHEITKYVNSSEIIVSGCGIREGIMYEYIDTHFKPIDDILDYSINGILEDLNINRPHAKNVFKLSKKLFEELKPLHHLGSEFDHILKTASMLHDCGTSIDYYNHHKHTFYIILNSYINGLSHKDHLMSAAIAASHRNNSYHISLPQFSSIINRMDFKIIEELGVILKISEGLDRSLSGSVTDLSVSIDEDNVVLHLYSCQNLDLEISQASRAAEKFKEVYGKDLLINQVCSYN